METTTFNIYFFRNSTRILFILMLLPWFPIAVWALVFINDGSATSAGVHIGSYSTLLYPLLVALSIYLTRNSRMSQLSISRIALRSLIPLLSLFPWLFMLLVVIGGLK